MATPGSMNCSPAVASSRPAAGRMCAENSLTSMPPPAPRSPKKRSVALASSMRSRKSSTDCHPSGDDSGASSSQSRLPRHWLLGRGTANVAGGRFRMRHAPQERIVRREIAQDVVNAAKGFEGPLGLRVEEKRQGPPKLHDLP